MKRFLTIIAMVLAPLMANAAVTHPGAASGGSGGIAPGEGITWANSFINAFYVGGGSTRKWAIYDDPTDGLQFICVVSDVPNDCNYIRLLAAGKYFGLTNAGGTPIFRVTESTGRITYAVVREEHHWRVATVQNGAATLNFDTPASNPPTAAAIVGTNTIVAVMDFNDTTDNSFQDSWILPAGFTGSIDVHFRWLAAATTGSVAWCAQLVRIAVGATGDPAFPAQATGNCVSDAANGTTLQENTATISGVTCTSCVAGDRVAVRISRDPDETSTRTDTMTGNARLISYGRTWDKALQ
jgi:hypothetical protein